MTAIKSVIFDWGGVLIEDPAPVMIQYITDILGVNEEPYIYVNRELVTDFRTGRIGEATFWQRVCGQLKVPTPVVPSLWGAAFRAAYRARAEMFALARKLGENGLKIALLSNTEMPAVQFFDEQGYDFFDVVVFSCVEGTKKPEREIYELTLKKLECQPGQAVLVDDHESCIEGARAVGINAILFENPSQVKGELARLGVKID